MYTINVLDTVQQIMQSMFWMVSLTFDLIHFCGTVSSKYPLIIVSTKLNASGSDKINRLKRTCVEMMYHTLPSKLTIHVLDGVHQI